MGLSGAAPLPHGANFPLARVGFPRRHYSEGAGVPAGEGGCCGHQWDQVEINEMVLTMRNGIYEACHPIRHRGASKPRPLLAHPWTPGPPLPRSSGYPCGCWGSAEPQRPVSAPVLWGSGTGRVAFGEPRPRRAQTEAQGCRALGMARVPLTPAPPGPL